MRMIRNAIAMAGLAIAIAVTMASQARADIIDFYLTQAECTGGCGAGSAPALISTANAVEVIVDELTTTTATVEFVAPGATTFTSPVWIKVNGVFDASSTAGLAPTSPCGFGLTACASGSEDHFGTFNVGTGGGSHSTITINLTAENGTTWADAAAVLTSTTDFATAPYSHGFEAVVATFTPPGGGTTTQYAGYYTPVPEPASLTLLGVSLIGFGVARRRRRNS